MINKAASITNDDAAQYQKDGVIVLRAMFDDHWVETLRAAIVRLRATEADRMPPPGRPNMSAPTGPRFFIDQFCWKSDPGLTEFVLSSPASEIAGRLMSAHHSIFFYDQVFVKDSGSADPTPWHQDLSYWPVAGDQIASVWVALDTVTPNSGALQYVRGSHRWPDLYRAVNFLPELMPDAAFDERFNGPSGERPPNVFERPEDFDIVTWSLEPGDCVIHHPRLLHGAPGNTSSRLRRGYATRWMGEDVTWDLRSGTMPVLGEPTDKTVPSGEWYPLVWQQTS